MPTEEQENRIDALVDRLYEEGRIDALRRSTAAFDACPESGKLAFSLGQEHQHAGDHREAALNSPRHHAWYDFSID